MSTLSIDNLAVPLLSRYNVKSLALIIGFVVSNTLTIKSTLSLFPLISTTLKLTILKPTLLQLNAVFVIEREANVQLSVEALSAMLADTKTVPAAPK